MTAFQPLFYALDTPALQLFNLVFGAAVQPAVDTIVFADETGGDQDRQLALPYLPGMDAVTIDDASLAFRVGELPLDIGGYSVSTGPAGQGVVLRLAQQARLSKVELHYPAPAPAPKQTMRLIVRPADGSNYGAPIFAAPDFPPPGPTFGRVLSGISVTELGGDRHLVTLPDLLGSAWLFQLATNTATDDDPSGGGAAKLAPIKLAPTIARVVIAAAPRNLSVTLTATPPTPLWSNPGLLLPDSGEQEVSFLPIAQRTLSAALAAAPPGALTLPLPLRFHSDSGARLEVTRRTLAGRYLVHPFGDAPATARLGGRAAAITLGAPAALRPASGTATLTAKLLGRTLNAGSRVAPLGVPGHGVRAGAERQVAARVPIAARPGAAAGAAVPIASVALRLAVPEPAELVVELRADAAGRPGAPFAPAIVRQFDAGFADWAEFVLPAPAAAAPSGTIWVALRLTKGIAFWHADAGGGPITLGAACVSVDRGASWGDASTTLDAPAPLLVQAFHAEDLPYPRPAIRVREGGTLLPADWFAAATAESPTQYRLPAAAIPQAILTRLATAAAAPGQPRARTAVLLDSASVLDLTLTDATLYYDPGAAAGG